MAKRSGSSIPAKTNESKRSARPGRNERPKKSRPLFHCWLHAEQIGTLNDAVLRVTITTMRPMSQPKQIIAYAQGGDHLKSWRRWSRPWVVPHFTQTAGSTVPLESETAGPTRNAAPPQAMGAGGGKP